MTARAFTAVWLFVCKMRRARQMMIRMKHRCVTTAFAAWMGWAVFEVADRSRIADRDRFRDDIERAESLLEKRVLIPLPDANARLVMFKLNLGKEDHILTDEDFRHLASITEGCLSVS